MFTTCMIIKIKGFKVLSEIRWVPVLSTYFKIRPTVRLRRGIPTHHGQYLQKVLPGEARPRPAELRSPRLQIFVRPRAEEMRGWEQQIFARPQVAELRSRGWQIIARPRAAEQRGRGRQIFAIVDPLSPS